MDLIVRIIMLLQLFVIDGHLTATRKPDPEVYFEDGYCFLQNCNGLSTLMGAKKCESLSVSFSNITELSGELFEGLSATTGLHTLRVLRGNVGSIYLPNNLIWLALDGSGTMLVIIDANDTYKLEELTLYRLSLLPNNIYKLQLLKSFVCSKVDGANIDLSGFNKMIQLEKIIITSTASVETSVSLHLPSLRKLVIGNSSITFNVSACWRFPNLDSLSLQSNELLVIPEHFSSFTNLTSFHVKNNKLRHVRLELFANMKQLKIVNLMDNEILRITTDSMVELPRLERLYLDKNGMIDLNVTSWIVPVLDYLSLSENQLQRVPGLLELFTAKKLHTLLMFDNPWDCEWVMNTLQQIPYMEIFVMHNGTCFAFGINMGFAW